MKYRKRAFHSEGAERWEPWQVGAGEWHIHVCTVGSRAVWRLGGRRGVLRREDGGVRALGDGWGGGEPRGRAEMLSSLLGP